MVSLDPRPRVVADGADQLLDGMRCTACAYPVFGRRLRCPNCSGPMADARFGPEGTVWSATVVRVPVPGRTPPYGLAYVDVDDGPRILAHVDGDQLLEVGTRVRLTPTSPGGDPTV